MADRQTRREFARLEEWVEDCPQRYDVGVVMDMAVDLTAQNTGNPCNAGYLITALAKMSHMQREVVEAYVVQQATER